MATILEMAVPVLGATAAGAEVQMTDKQARWALGYGLGKVKTGQSTPDTTTDEPGPVFPRTDTEVAPATGAEAGGTAVSIYGKGFTGATGVKFGADNATSVVVVNDGKITCASPAHAAGAVAITIVMPGDDIVIASPAFTYA